MFGKVDKTTGDVSEIAGLGELVPSVSLYQSGSVSGASAQSTTLAPGAFTVITITLPTPMPDANYIVEAGTDSAYLLAEESPNVRRTTSFRLYLTNQSLNETVDVSEITITWQAFKLMTDQQTALDEAQIIKNKNNFAALFSTSTSYAVGSYCIYDGNLYRCTTAHTGTWNASHFTATSVGGTLGNIVPSDASSSNKLVTSSTVASKTISGVTPTVSQGVGTISTVNFCQAGKVVIGRITVTDATLTYHGNTTLILQLPDSVPQPMITVDTVGTYFNNTLDTVCHCKLGSDRKITVYSNSSDGESVANADVWLTVMYIAQ